MKLSAWVAAVGGLLAGPVCEAFGVFGFVGHANVTTMDWDHVLPHLTHLMIGAMDVSMRGDLALQGRLPNSESAEWTAVREAATRHGVKLMINVGGYGRRTPFDAVVDDLALRKVLADYLAAFVEIYQLDGVDLDVALPSEIDRQNNFADFLQTLKASLGKSKIVSLAVHPGPRHRMANHVLDVADFVHLVAYDNWCAFPVSAKPPCRHSEYKYAEEVIKHFMGIHQVRREVTTLGIPFFARHVLTGEMKNYNGWVADNPGAGREVDEAGGFFLNGPKTVQAKVQLAFNNRLGGVMLYDVGHDAPPSTSRSLLPMIHQTVDELMLRYHHEEEF